MQWWWAARDFKTNNACTHALSYNSYSGACNSHVAYTSDSVLVTHPKSVDLRTVHPRHSFTFTAAIRTRTKHYTVLCRLSQDCLQYSLATRLMQELVAGGGIHRRFISEDGGMVLTVSTQLLLRACYSFPHHMHTRANPP